MWCLGTSDILDWFPLSERYVYRYVTLVAGRISERCVCVGMDLGMSLVERGRGVI